MPVDDLSYIIMSYQHPDKVLLDRADVLEELTFFIEEAQETGASVKEELKHFNARGTGPAAHDNLLARWQRGMELVHPFIIDRDRAEMIERHREWAYQQGYDYDSDEDEVIYSSDSDYDSDSD